METTQGAKSKQQTLRPTGSSSTSSSGTPSAPIFPKAPPRPTPAPLYTTDPATRADAARVPGYAADPLEPQRPARDGEPAWRSAHTSVAADFVEGYYKNSRLHHLATLEDGAARARAGGPGACGGGAGGGVVRKVPAEAGVSMRGAMLGVAFAWKGEGEGAGC